MPKQALVTKESPIPRVGEGKRGENGHVGYLLRQASAAFRLEMERALSEFDITPPQFSVLTMLIAYPGASNADIARLSMLTPQTVSVIVGNLERAGLIRRTPHQIHGRIQQIDATDNGKKMLARCRRRVQVLEDGLMSGLNQEEESTVRRWLVSVATKAFSKS